MVEMTGIHAQHVHPVGIVMFEVARPRDNPVLTLRRKKASKCRKPNQ